MTQATAQPPTQAPSAPEVPKKKTGCGCFLWGCFGTLFLLFLFTVGGGVTLWYGFKNFTTFTDPVILWSYQNIARPKIIETLPPNLSRQEKQRVMGSIDSGVQKYVDLTPGEKKVLLKELVLASYYYSQNQIIPPEKIPNLRKFIESHIQSHRQQMKQPRRNNSP